MFHVWGNRHNLILYIEYGLEASFEYLQYLDEKMQKSKHYVTS